MARGVLSQGLSSFIIINDSVALETIEQYILSFNNPSITNSLILGSGALIRIIDDDGKKLLVNLNKRVKLFIHLSLN